MNWKDKKIHFVGIKGSGMCGLAILLKGEGAVISGSDTAEVFPADEELRINDIKFKLFSEENISKDIDLVIYSLAWNTHEEMAKARGFGIKELSYGEALGEYAKNKETIVITGTHGKTTTTALLGQIFEAGGLDPSVLTGDRVKAWGSSVRAGHGKYFIVEGDEYYEKFKYFSPVGIIIPSLDYDHTDYFKTEADYKKSFAVWIKVNPLAKLITEPEKSDENIFAKAKFIFPGEHYKRNAILAIGMARFFGIKENDIISGINAFKGVGRRLDFYTPENGEMVIVYDYAHHPAEIKATLSALRVKYRDYKLVAIFQPHTYSRTKAFLGDFAKAFTDADEVFYEDIYASAREVGDKGMLNDLIAETNKNKSAHPLSNFEIKNYSGKILLVFMGAGDIWQKAKKLASSLLSS